MSIDNQTFTDLSSGNSLYVIDPYTNPVANAAILDVQVNKTAYNYAGGFPVLVRDDLRVSTPTNYGDLIAKKYQALLSTYPGFTRVVFDDLSDTSGIDLTSVTTKGSFGNRGTILLPPTGCLTSLTAPLAVTPTQVVVVWESAAKYLSTELGTTYKYRGINTTPMSSLTCEVSFDGGTNWSPCTNGGILLIDPLKQGNSLRVRLTAPASLAPLSWAVIY